MLYLHVILRIAIRYTCSKVGLVSIIELLFPLVEEVGGTLPGKEDEVASPLSDAAICEP